MHGGAAFDTRYSWFPYKTRVLPDFLGTTLKSILFIYVYIYTSHYKFEIAEGLIRCGALCIRVLYTEYTTDRAKSYP